MMEQIAPSPQARQVYNMMVNHADDNNGELHLTLASSIALSCSLQRRGEDSQAMTAVTELCEANWIAPVEGGGWRVG
jgi:hypothetical protein